MTQAADLTLTYERGHDLAGYLTLQVHPDGRAEATRSDVGDLDRESGERVLTPAQLQRLSAAIDTSGVLSAAGSSRAIGDDEVPISVTITRDGERNELRIWEKDAASNTDFMIFDTVVCGLIDEVLSTD